MVCKESPLSLTKDIMASMMAMKPASACSLPCAVNTGRPAGIVSRCSHFDFTLRHHSFQSVRHVRALASALQEGHLCCRAGVWYLRC